LKGASEGRTKMGFAFSLPSSSLRVVAMSSLSDDLDHVLTPRDRGEVDEPEIAQRPVVPPPIKQCPVCGRAFLQIKGKRFDTYTCTKRAYHLRRRGDSLPFSTERD
jgi:hypothetical protein